MVSVYMEFKMDDNLKRKSFYRFCPECNGEMEIKDVLISRTTDPRDEDLFEKMWACNKCDHTESIINSEEEIEE